MSTHYSCARSKFRQRKGRQNATVSTSEARARRQGPFLQFQSREKFLKGVNHNATCFLYARTTTPREIFSLAFRRRICRPKPQPRIPEQIRRRGRFQHTRISLWALSASFPDQISARGHFRGKSDAFPVGLAISAPSSALPHLRALRVPFIYIEKIPAIGISI